jgi:hypothetical protein
VTSETERRLLVLLLRVAGGLTVTAFLAMLMPGDWMAATHRWLGLGELPRQPVVEYLARSASALYGFHGVLLLLVSRDPDRHHAIVRFIGWMNIAFGAMMAGIDWQAGLPWWWTLGEGPPIAAFGLVVLWLSRARQRH